MSPGEPASETLFFPETLFFQEMLDGAMGMFPMQIEVSVPRQKKEFIKSIQI